MTEDDPKDLDNIKGDIKQALGKDFYAAVGHGISIWAGMEGQLVAIGALLLGISIARAGIVFYSILNFNVWLSVITELFAIAPQYPPQFKSEWNALSEKLRAENNIRVRLAHHTMVYDDGSDDPRTLATLRPGEYDTRLASKQHKPLTTNEIFDFMERVLDLYGALLALRKKMLPPDTSPEKS